MNGLHGIIFSYETRNKLGELGAIRSSSSLPFGGRYRTVDFALSNLVNVGVTDVGVVLHGQYQSLLDHLGTGKDWDLSRKRGGLRVLPPFNYQKEWGVMPFRGKMEALANVRSYLDTIRQDYVVMMEGDLVCNIPLADVFKAHLNSEADITAVVADDHFETENDTYFDLDENGRVVEVYYNTHAPRGHRSLEIYILKTELLKKIVDECAARGQYSWRSNVLGEKKNSLKINSFMWSGFAAQLRTVQEYFERSMQLLDEDVRADLFNPARPVLASSMDKPSTVVSTTADCTNALFSDGCRIEGHVENSIFFASVVVEPGAVVKNSVIFRNTVIRSGAELDYVIADKDVEIQSGVKLSGCASSPHVIEKGQVIKV